MVLLLFLVIKGTVSEGEKKEHDYDGHNVDNIDPVLLHHKSSSCVRNRLISVKREMGGMEKRRRGDRIPPHRKTGKVRNKTIISSINCKRYTWIPNIHLYFPCLVMLLNYQMNDMKWREGGDFIMIECGENGSLFSHHTPESKRNNICLTTVGVAKLMLEESCTSKHVIKKSPLSHTWWESFILVWERAYSYHLHETPMLISPFIFRQC